MKKINLPGNQEKIDVAPPKGKITAADFDALRNKKSVKKEVNTPNPPTDYSGKPSIPGLGPIVDMEEGADHEVAMAMSSLKEIVKAAQELMSKLGGQERNIPGWIQNHITNAENYIEQAAQGFHELEAPEEETDQVLTQMMESILKKRK